MRSVFSAGLLDEFLEQGFNPFQLAIGVSAGAANLSAYLAGAHGRSLRVFRDYALRPECINYLRFVRGGHLIDLDWLWEICAVEVPLDNHRVFANGQSLLVCLTDVCTGKAVYQRANAGNLEQVIKASSALPLMYREFPHVDGRPMADGGVADSIPVQKALDMGASRIMVVRSRPRQFRKRDQLVHKLVRRRLRQHYPALFNSMQERIKRHHDAIRLIRRPPPGIQVVEVCPPEDFTVGRLCRDRQKLLRGYRQGQAEARHAIRQWG